MKHIRKFETFEMDPSTMDVVDNDPIGTKSKGIKLELNSILNDLDDDFDLYEISFRIRDIRNEHGDLISGLPINDELKKLYYDCVKKWHKHVNNLSQEQQERLAMLLNNPDKLAAVNRNTRRTGFGEDTSAFDSYNYKRR